MKTIIISMASLYLLILI